MRRLHSRDDVAMPGARDSDREVRGMDQARGKWIDVDSAKLDLGVLRCEDFAWPAGFGTVRHAPVGSLVAAAGSHVSQVLVVIRGELHLNARVDGHRTTMAVVRRNGVIADIPLLLDLPMPFDAVAARDTELLALTCDRWLQLLRSRPALYLRWMASIARRLDDDRRRFVVLTTKPLVAQVAYLLLEMSEPGFDRTKIVSLSHKTIADLLGARRQSVSRALSDLRKQGFISTKYGATVILDETGLRHVLGDEPLVAADLLSQ
jgi:CRP-like cAMP-binding protein